MRDNLAALGFTLAPEHLARLDRASAIDRGFPYEFLARENIRALVYGDLWAEILDRRP